MLKFIPVLRTCHFRQRPAGADFAIHAEQKKWLCHLLIMFKWLYRLFCNILMQPPKVRKPPQKPTICPCGSTGNAPKTRGQSTFDTGVHFSQVRQEIQLFFLRFLAETALFIYNPDMMNKFFRWYFRTSLVLRILVCFAAGSVIGGLL